MNTDPQSSIPGVQWPAIPAGGAAAMLALQFQLEQSQWWPSDKLQAHQFRQLSLLLRHAQATVPYYQSRLAGVVRDREGGLTLDAFRALPLITRSDIQDAGNALLSRAVPPDHGAIARGETSGSTGRPIIYYGTNITQLFWRAFTLRDHLWQRRDFSGKLAAIRWSPGNQEFVGWGPATDGLYDTGPSAVLKIDTPIAEQLTWLRGQDPDYLLSYASNIADLARAFITCGARLPRLKEMRSIAEVVTPELRRLCHEAWGVPLVDVYSAQEVGYIALQCPDRPHFHLQSENVLVEVLRDDGRLCDAGETGRIVLTTLNNFAMPLIRYDIGDYAVVGAPCPCGRTLPVLERVMGRVRNMLVFPNGEKRWPLGDLVKLREITGVRQYQYVQKSRDRLELRMVVDNNYDRAQERALAAIVQGKFCYPFQLDFVYVDQIGRSAGGKFEDFVSELPSD